MRKWAVALEFSFEGIHLFIIDNAHSWREALRTALIYHSKVIYTDVEEASIETGADETMNSLSTDLEKAHENAADQDWEFQILEIN